MKRSRTINTGRHWTNSNRTILIDEEFYVDASIKLLLNILAHSVDNFCAAMI